MFELSFMISATEQARLKGCVSEIERPPTRSELGQGYILPKDLMIPASMAIATVKGLKVDPSS